MKTRREWYSILPLSIRNKVIFYLKREGISLDGLDSSFEMAMNAFSWSKTMEGIFFWSDITKKYKQQQ